MIDTHSGSPSIVARHIQQAIHGLETMGRKSREELVEWIKVQDDCEVILALANKVWEEWDKI